MTYEWQDSGHLSELGQIIDQLRIVNPRIAIVLAQVSPVSSTLPKFPHSMHSSQRSSQLRT